MSVEMKLKKKYRIPSSGKRTPYRTRTGPRCCNAGCPANKSERNKQTFKMNLGAKR